MINARARAMDSAIRFFYRTYLNGQKLALSVVVVLLQLLLNTYTINAHYQGFEKICKN